VSAGHHRPGRHRDVAKDQPRVKFNHSEGQQHMAPQWPMGVTDVH